MIVDVRTRIWTGKDPLSPAFARPIPRNADLDPSSVGHRRATRLADVTVIVGWWSERLGVRIPTEAVAGSVQEAPESRVGFAGVDPTCASALEDVDQAAELGMVGLTYAPADQGCRPTDDRALALFERAAKRGLPVLVANPCLTSAGSVMEFARPSLVDEAMRTISGLTIVHGDLGHAWVDEALLMIAKHERAFAEISGLVGRSWSLYTSLLQAHERGVLEKLLFASGYPNETPERAIERIYTVNAMRGSSLPGIPREALRGIVERDALAALGVEHLASGRAATQQRSASRRHAPDRAAHR